MIKVNIRDKATIAGQNFLNVCESTTREVDSLEKLLKIFARCFEIIQTMSGTMSRAFENLNSKIKDTLLVFSSIKVISSVQKVICLANELLCKDKEGKYFFTNPKNSIVNRVSRVSVAIHYCFKIVKNLNKLKLLSLGVLAKNAIGKLPIFDLITDSFKFFNNLFKVADAIAYRFPEDRKNIRTAREKLKKWKRRPELIRRLKTNDLTVLDAFRTTSLKTHELVTHEILYLNEKRGLESDQANKDNIDPEIRKLEGRLKRIEHRLRLIESKDCLALAADLEKQKIDGYGGKIHRWTTIEKNLQILEKKNWLLAIKSISKIALVVITLSAAAIYGGVWSLPLALTILILANVNDAIGLIKILYEELAREAPIPSTVNQKF